MPQSADQKNDYEHPVQAGSLRQVDGAARVFVRIDETADGQRLDNFLMKLIRGVPKGHIYRIVREGEVRVNKGRSDVGAKLSIGDIVRIPPIRVARREEQTPVPAIRPGTLPVLFEDRHLLIVNKPSGLAAHGGSGVAFGLIEQLRASRPAEPMLELAHRLDRDTSGAIIVCKSRKALVRLQQMQREGGQIEKHYRLLVQGDWVNQREHVKKPLFKYTLPSGERRVRVDEERGLPSHTIFTLIRRFGPVSLLDAELKTGRTHQIRVHAQSCGFPLVGDDKYGSYEFNEAVAKGSLGVPFKRMFLHACRLKFAHPVSGEALSIDCPLPAECQRLIDHLAKESE
jgi:23S rRNA pseudouridine955/2504/2580 synthase